MLTFSLILSLSKDGLIALDPSAIIREVRRVAQEQSPVDALEYGFNTCAGLSAGEIIGWTLGMSGLTNVASEVAEGLWGLGGSTAMRELGNDITQQGIGLVQVPSIPAGRKPATAVTAATSSRALAAAGVSSGTTLGLSGTLATGFGHVQLCYEGVAAATGFVVSTQVYDGPRLGFLWIDNQTGQELTVKLQWLGWATTQDITVPARAGGDTKHSVWALGPAVLQYVTIVQAGVSPVMLYRRGVVPINTVIGAVVTQKNSAAPLEVSALRGVSIT